MRLTGTPPASLISRMPSHEVSRIHSCFFLDQTADRAGGQSDPFFFAFKAAQLLALYPEFILTQKQFSTLTHLYIE